mmetsp:Transcript_40596/g.115262  ORF Transcript_40596/g.115262 Transcript_40596/m.115262 type:complete len:226 (+) Transcript_40596:177-854(+)
MSKHAKWNQAVSQDNAHISTSSSGQLSHQSRPAARPLMHTSQPDNSKAILTLDRFSCSLPGIAGAPVATENASELRRGLAVTATWSHASERTATPTSLGEKMLPRLTSRGRSSLPGSRMPIVLSGTSAANAHSSVSSSDTSSCKSSSSDDSSLKCRPSESPKPLSHSSSSSSALSADNVSESESESESESKSSKSKFVSSLTSGPNACAHSASLTSGPNACAHSA